MTRIFIVRHGETEGNKNKIYRGRWDLPLNRNGEVQVARAGESLKDLPLDAIYTSPLKRAQQTAAAMSTGRSIKPVDEEALIDIDYGSWTRLPEVEARQRYKDLYQSWKNTPEKVTFPEGESLNDVRLRLETRLPVLLKRHADQTIALASHRVTIKVLLCFALGLDNSAFWNIQAGTASISALEYTDRFSLLFSNESCHLLPLTEQLGIADF